MVSTALCVFRVSDCYKATIGMRLHGNQLCIIPAFVVGSASRLLLPVVVVAVVHWPVSPRSSPCWVACAFWVFSRRYMISFVFFPLFLLVLLYRYCWMLFDILCSYLGLFLCILLVGVLMLRNYSCIACIAGCCARPSYCFLRGSFCSLFW